MSLRSNTEEFIEAATKIHGNLYDYSMVEYIDNTTKVEIICKWHGPFWQRPSNHKTGYGCMLCGLNTASMRKMRKASEEFLEKAVAVHGHTYDYNLVDYKGKAVKVQILCDEHGVFNQTPNAHLLGCGCPSCSRTGFDKTKSATLYYLKVSYNNSVAYKIGITNKTVQERFSSADLKKIQVLETWKYPIGKDAYDKEQEILNLYRDFKYKGEPLLRSGNTELFSTDVLGLDVSPEPSSSSS